MIEVETILKPREYSCNACITGVAVTEIKMGDPQSRLAFRLCKNCREELNLQLVVIIS